MCGLVGIISSNLLLKHKEMMSCLLYLDTFRGKDSTGIACIRKNGAVALHKQTLPGYEFVQSAKFESTMSLADICWIGHNRFGTVGKVNKMNAHPFIAEDHEGNAIISGAHNGTLKNKHVLPNHLDYGTDSEALYNAIAADNLKDVLAKVEGAWALTFYDHFTDELKIIRNKERTLYYAYEEGRKSIIWASEIWMIKVACSRSGIKIEDDAVFAFEEDTLYTFPAPAKINDVITFEKEGGIVGKAADFFPQAGQHWWGGQGRTYSPVQQQTETHKVGTSSTSQSGTTQSVTNTSTKSGTPTQASGGNPLLKRRKSSTTRSSATATKEDESKVYRGFRGVELSYKQIKGKLEQGCGWCDQEPISVHDAFGWLGANTPVCTKCLNGDIKPSVVHVNDVISKYKMN